MTQAEIANPEVSRRRDWRPFAPARGQLRQELRQVAVTRCSDIHAATVQKLLELGQIGAVGPQRVP